MAFEHEDLYVFTFQQEHADAKSGSAATELQGLGQRVVRRPVSVARVRRHLAQMGRTGEPLYDWWEVIVRVPSSPPGETDAKEGRAAHERFEQLGKKFDALSLVLEHRMYRPGMEDDLPAD